MSALVIRDNPKSLGAEAFRTLRTNIDFFNIDKNLKTLAITSPTPGDGKSTTISNLAIAIAQSGKSVILVDCDLRRPVVHKLFSISNNLGITDMLVNKDSTKEYIHRTDIENLYLLPCGTKPPNPAEVLNSDKMNTIIKGLKERFDIVLLDVPPILAVADSRIVCGRADGVILLCSYGQTPKSAIVQSKHELTKIKANLIGAILTKVPQNKGNYSYYYYGDYINTGKDTARKNRNHKKNKK
ncbi:MAG: CpsD/CapB family tyrosine-protein kinase [Clostridium sp.]